MSSVTTFVAEIAVEKAEKGDRIQPGDVVYGRFWNKKWIGKGDPDPHASGHSGPAKGATVFDSEKRCLLRFAPKWL